MLDCSAPEYISPADLRVIFKAQKQMNARERMILTGVNETVKEVFDTTGFADIFNIE